MLKDAPVLIRLIGRAGWDRGVYAHRAWVFVLTFAVYMSYHATRKPMSIVKSTLQSNYTASGWAPFNERSDGNSLLGDLDTAFLFSYAIGMFFSGHLGDRMNLRYFLTIGMVGSALFISAIGLAYFTNIHSLAYFITFQVMAGLFQSTGWPAVVSVMGNWFGKSKKGFIMGLWNAHTSVGNIVGALIATAALSANWGLAFILPSLVMFGIAVLVFLFLVVHPEDVGLDGTYLTPTVNDSEAIEPLDTKRMLNSAHNRGSTVSVRSHHDLEGISFFRAWAIPGVAEFAFCLFFCKLVSYTFLYWLPYYLNHTPIDGKILDPHDSGNISTFFDVGGLIGGVLAGILMDLTNSPALVSGTSLLISLPLLYCYRTLANASVGINIFVMILSGIFVNGPYSLITTAVSADLGTHPSLMGNSKALSTVTAIIDGTGSIGAALGPFLAGAITSSVNDEPWNDVFWMLMGMLGMAALLLTRLMYKEIRSIHARRTNKGYVTIANEWD